MTEWIFTTPERAIMIAVSALSIYFVMIVLTRISGLRSFSKMSSFDFVMTIAMGSILASVTLSETPAILDGLVALTVLFGMQFGVAWWRRRSSTFSSVVDNEPRLLMLNGEMIPDAMDIAKVTEDDIVAKLREANVLNFSQVRAVILETTGDISVLHSRDPSEELQDRLLKSVLR